MIVHSLQAAEAPFSSAKSGDSQNSLGLIWRFSEQFRLDLAILRLDLAVLRPQPPCRSSTVSLVASSVLIRRFSDRAALQIISCLFGGQLGPDQAILRPVQIGIVLRLFSAAS